VKTLLEHVPLRHKSATTAAPAMSQSQA